MEKESKKKKGESKDDEIKLRNENLYLLGGPDRVVRAKNLKDDLRIVEEDYNKKIDDLPKEFEYYCQSCLFQTNEFSKSCPKCNEGRLLKSK